MFDFVVGCALVARITHEIENDDCKGEHEKTDEVDDVGLIFECRVRVDFIARNQDDHSGMPSSESYLQDAVLGDAHENSSDGQGEYCFTPESMAKQIAR